MAIWGQKSGYLGIEAPVYPSTLASHVLILDSFDEGSQTDITAHTPNRFVSDSAYSKVNTFGTMENIYVQSGEAYANETSSSVSTALAVIDSGSSAVIVEAEFQHNTSFAGGVGPALAGNSSFSSGYELDIISSPPAYIRLQRNGSTVGSNYDISGFFSIGTWYTLRIEFDGTTVKGYIDDTETHSYTDGSPLTGTHVAFGVAGDTDSGNSRVRNFVVRPNT